jgi:hypothetical protein
MSVETLRRAWVDLDWVEELLYLNVLATEACMIYPWQLLVYGLIGHEALPFWGLCVLLWVPYGVASLLNRSKLTADRRQALVAALMLIGVLLTVRAHVYGRHPIWDLGWIADMVEGLFNTLSVLPPELMAIMLVLITWWRGIVASRHEYDIQHIWFRFRLGVVLLIVYFFVTLLGRRADLTALIFAYFFFGLMGIALARILELGGIHHSTLGSKQWVGVLAGSVLGNLALALLASLLFSRQAVRTILGWFQPLIQLVQWLLWHFLAIMAYLIWPLLEWAFSWMRRLGSEDLFLFQSSPLGSPLVNPLELAEVEESANWLPWCRTISILLIVVGGLFLVARAIRRLAEQRAEREEVERESLWSGEDFVNDLRNALLRGLEQLRNLGQFADRHRRSAESIRKIYASMVDLATEVGYPRQLAETPYEYRGTLHRAFAGGEGAVDAITEAYVRVHYGQVPDSEEEMDQIRRYWQLVQTLATPRAAEQEA